MKSKITMRRVNSEEFHLDPKRYELRSGNEPEAPSCPYGNRYEWIGYDLKTEEFVRFTKSVLKKLVNEKG